MTTLVPTSQPTGVEAYEDMFKEITRKLYGEETGHGLHTLGTPVAHLATGGPTAPEGERSFTTLMSDRSLTTIDYEHGGTETSNPFKAAEDHLATFGLAALMQNGFSPSHHLSGATNNKANNSASANSSANTTATTAASANTANTSGDERWASGNEDCLPWSNTKIANYTTPTKIFKGKHREQQSQDGATNNNNNNTKQTQNGVNNGQGAAVQKRYSCSSCPYSTDRRDLFTRHENIHKAEKPFHCYACLKQFNRADHVKKHFLRMHREMPYDINKTRRIPSTNQKTNTYYPPSQQQQSQASQNAQQQQQMTSPLSIGQNNGYSGSQQVGQQAQQPDDDNQASGHQELEQKLNIKIKTEKSPKKKGDKRFVCCYCPWSGADNWGLRRHLNTHTKPFVCMLCDYKAARSERLATHVFKVHNKKACNKCNFLADTQEQFQAHQTEAHSHDTRPNRSTNSNSNVLRTIGNTFNNNQSNNIQNNVFGCSASNIQTTNSSIYTNNSTTNSSMSELVNQNLISSWRSGESSAATQKRGAERLFQYLEADGSDPEDYSRQMQMAALSRNTASVAQDFHNAGGGFKKQQHSPSLPSSLVSSSSLSSISANAAVMAAAAAVAAITKGDGHHAHALRPEDLLAILVGEHEKHELKQEHQHTATTAEAIMAATSAATAVESASLGVSPPASNSNQLKRRRKSTNNKENENNSLLKIPKTNHNNNVRIKQEVIEPAPTSGSLNYETDLDKLTKSLFRDVISRYYQEPGCSATTDSGEDDDAAKLQEYLQNRTELTISVQSRDGSTGEKRSRKQRQPRKMIQAPTETMALTKIRDKHLIRLVSPKKACRFCTHNEDVLTFPYHTTTSLLLHHLWRHTERKQEHRCKSCPLKFEKRYSLLVHQKVVHAPKRKSAASA